jgi:hypothetical protein
MIRACVMTKTYRAAATYGFLAYALGIVFVQSALDERHTASASPRFLRRTANGTCVRATLLSQPADMSVNPPTSAPYAM